MIILKGKAVQGGVSKGRVCFLQNKKAVVYKYDVANPYPEIERFELAKSKALSELKRAYHDASKRLGSEDAEILLSHQVILDDADFSSMVIAMIKDFRINAEFAVVKTAREYSKILCRSGSDYIKSRTEDIKDVSRRVVRHILGLPQSDLTVLENCILFADRLLPSEVVSLADKNIPAICLKHGVESSHAVIIAQKMNVPVVIGIRSDLSWYDGTTAIVDGYNGVVYIEPDDVTEKKLWYIEHKTKVL